MRKHQTRGNQAACQDDDFYRWGWRGITGRPARGLPISDRGPSSLLPVDAQDVVRVFREYLLAHGVKTGALFHINRVMDDAGSAGRVARVYSDEFGCKMVLVEDLSKNFIGLLYAPRLDRQIYGTNKLFLLWRFQDPQDNECKAAKYQSHLPSSSATSQADGGANEHRGTFT